MHFDILKIDYPSPKHQQLVQEQQLQLQQQHQHSTQQDQHQQITKVQITNNNNDTTNNYYSTSQQQPHQIKIKNHYTTNPNTQSTSINHTVDSNTDFYHSLNHHQSLLTTTSNTPSVNNSLKNAANLTTFKHIANNASPIISGKSSGNHHHHHHNHQHNNELHVSHLSSVGSIGTNDDEDLNILNNEIMDSKLDLDDEEENEDHHHSHNSHSLQHIQPGLGKNAK